MLYRNSNRCRIFQVSPFLIRPFGAPSPRGKVLLSIIPTNTNLSHSNENENRSLGGLRFAFLVGQEVQAIADGAAEKVQYQIVYVAGAEKGDHLA